MVATFTEELIKKMTMDPRTIAILLQAGLGLSISVLTGQIVAFIKYINLNEPVLQIFSFIMTKSYNFIMNSIKYLAICLLVYLGIKAASFFTKTDLVQTKITHIYLAYSLFAVVSFGFGFSKERTRSLSENMMTRNS